MFEPSGEVPPRILPSPRRPANPPAAGRPAAGRPAAGCSRRAAHAVACEEAFFDEEMNFEKSTQFVFVVKMHILVLRCGNTFDIYQMFTVSKPIFTSIDFLHF